MFNLFGNEVNSISLPKSTHPCYGEVMERLNPMLRELQTTCNTQKVSLAIWYKKLILRRLIEKGEVNLSQMLHEIQKRMGVIERNSFVFASATIFLACVAIQRQPGCFYMGYPEDDQLGEPTDPNDEFFPPKHLEME